MKRVITILSVSILVLVALLNIDSVTNNVHISEKPVSDKINVPKEYSETPSVIEKRDATTIELDAESLEMILSQSFSSQIKHDTFFPEYSKPFDLQEFSSFPEAHNVFDIPTMPFTVSLDKKIYTTTDPAVISLTGANNLKVLVNQKLIFNQSPSKSLTVNLADYELPITITIIDDVASVTFTLELNILSPIQGSLLVDRHPVYETNQMTINYQLDTPETGNFMIRTLLHRDGVPVAVLTSENNVSNKKDNVTNAFQVDAELLQQLDKGEHIWSLKNTFIEKLGGPLDNDKVLFISEEFVLFGVEGSALSVDDNSRIERQETRLNLLKPFFSNEL
ncbi:hypothetical protein [Photobacterium leiognathi]|uniref:Uncharacterized protein n=1 Tax=Photobacterium leiognathi TaxID=553611 RepID=A0A2T3M7E1_PHOLE|nr:hypothetical protein [Photobacterium leiognathi]KJF97105.1 hypothetical protein UB34_14710 [Photobacterium leiognathi]PSV88130.1 hypothetical protein CTM89_15230 [Photobacterium leiognathi]